jgi:hypothetical protein
MLAISCVPRDAIDLDAILPIAVVGSGTLSIRALLRVAYRVAMGIVFYACRHLPIPARTGE